MSEENNTNSKIYEILFEKDDVTWQTIISELIKSDEIDPWDIDISHLTQRYIEVVNKLKEFDFNISGKALLAAAILLKIKSNRLVGEDLDEFDRIIAGANENTDLLADDESEFLQNTRISEQEKNILIPRLPQPRKRKISIHDLMGALEKALEVKQRRLFRNSPYFNIDIPKKTQSANLTIQKLYLKIQNFFHTENKKLTFADLVPSENKMDKIYTLIPLLHLSNKSKIDLQQEKAFGEIMINLKAEKEVQKELNETL